MFATISEPPAGQASPHLAAAEATPSQPISARNGQLYGVDGQPLTIKGVNWFGFETSVTAVHGLWQVLLMPLACGLICSAACRGCTRFGGYFYSRHGLLHSHGSVYL